MKYKMKAVNAIVKIGGSVIANPKALKTICREIAGLARKGHKIVILPGGGALADAVRSLSMEYRTTDSLAHWMAIAAMDINGMLIAGLNKSFVSVTGAKDCMKALNDKRVPVFLAHRLLKRGNPLPQSWSVTSDSIALYLSHALKAEHNILVKSVRGIYSGPGRKKFISKIRAPELIKKKYGDCVDECLPELSVKYGRDTHIVAASCRGGIEGILSKRKSAGTVIVP
ncbi:MAG: hypothetical protein WC559_04320 [Candidatus Omnitrophota bacterium]